MSPSILRTSDQMPQDNWLAIVSYPLALTILFFVFFWTDKCLEFVLEDELSPVGF
jgi:hypothetical protein